jgi:hypothetical protein
MAKIQRNKRKRNTKRAALIQDTAELTGLSTRSVERVLAADQKNPTALAVFMELEEGYENLRNQVKTLVPFNKPETNE